MFCRFCLEEYDEPNREVYDTEYADGTKIENVEEETCPHCNGSLRINILESYEPEEEGEEE